MKAVYGAAAVGVGLAVSTAARADLMPMLPTISADVNLDGVTNTADLAIIQGHLGQNYGEPSWRLGDVNGDGMVDARDVDLYSSQEGKAYRQPTIVGTTAFSAINHDGGGVLGLMVDAGLLYVTVDGGHASVWSLPEAMCVASYADGQVYTEIDIDASACIIPVTVLCDNIYSFNRNDNSELVIQSTPENQDYWLHVTASGLTIVDGGGSEVHWNMAQPVAAVFETVPEPGSLGLLGAGGVMLLLKRRGKKR